MKAVTGKGRTLTNTHNEAYWARLKQQFEECSYCHSGAYNSSGNGTNKEITAMAADAGLISSNRDIISIGGSNQGADTALVIKPANSKRLFEMKIKEIIAIPSVRK